MTKIKAKTRKSVAKRMKTTGTGKFKRYKANKGHLLTSKSRKRKRKLRQRSLVSHAEEANVRKLLPYG